jgi:hypothetical protein
MQLITPQAGGVTLAANRKREFSFAPPRVSHRDGFPIKNAERVFFIARADQRVFAANVTPPACVVSIYFRKYEGNTVQLSTRFS